MGDADPLAFQRSILATFSDIHQSKGRMLVCHPRGLNRVSETRSNFDGDQIG
jgi:hypothetical protein